MRHCAPETVLGTLKSELNIHQALSLVAARFQAPGVQISCLVHFHFPPQHPDTVLLSMVGA